MSIKDNNNSNINWKIANDDDGGHEEEDKLKSYWNNDDTIASHQIDGGLQPTKPVPSIFKSFDENDYINNNIDNDNDNNDNEKSKSKLSINKLKEMLGIPIEGDDDKQQSLYTSVTTTAVFILNFIKLNFLGTSPLFVPQYYDHYNVLKQKKRYKLNILQRLFVMLDVPSSCQVGSITSILIFSVILLSCTAYVISTLPLLKYQPDTCDSPICQDSEYCPGETICEPQDPLWNQPIEFACVIIFSIEYVVRMFLVSFVPPRLSELIPSSVTKFKLENAMINDELSIFHFVKKSLLAGISQRSSGLGESDDPQNEDEIHDVSSYLCNWYENDDVDQNEPHINNTGLADNDERIKERLDMTWYVKLYKYGTSIMNIVDLAAILPFYIEISTTKTSVAFIRILRLARVFRIFKMGKSSTGVMIIIKTMKKASAALAIVMFFIPLGIIFFGSLIFLFEGGTYTVDETFPNGAYVRSGFWGISEESPYTGIPSSMYWAVVTSTTTGYGDLHPTTLWGRIIAMICMYYGVLLMALPITVIGNNFNREYDKMHGNNDEKMIYECLSDLAKITYDEAIIKAQGQTPADTSSFRLTRLLLILTTFDLTKSDALKEGLSTTMKIRRKLDKEMRDDEARQSEKSSNLPSDSSSFKQTELLSSLKNEVVADREDLLRAIVRLQSSIKK